MIIARSHTFGFALVLAISFTILLTTIYSVADWNTINLDHVTQLVGITKPTSRPTFYEIARKYGTDKVSTHKYHHMYQKYLEPMRERPLKMLEIGLGCDMNYGPGASYYTWLEFLPQVDLYYIEHDKACADKWAASTKGVTIFSGDQADIPFLKDFLVQTGGVFDIIVDDGGHSMIQQLASLDTLLPSVKPGGLYFCEDLHTSYIPMYGGGEDVKDTTMERIKGSLDDLMRGLESHETMSDIFGIDCMREVCAFQKKQVGEYY